MSDTLSISAPADLTIYFNTRDLDSLVWDGADFVSYDVSDIADYAISMTGDESGSIYTGTFPAVEAGNYITYAYVQSGDAPALGDVCIGSGSILFDGESIVPGVDLSSLEADLAAISAKITSQQITVIAPAQMGSILSIILGDDYLDADDRAITFTTTSSAQWPVLTSATVSLILEKQANIIASGVDSIEFTGVVAQATGANKSVKVDITTEESSTLAKGTSAYRYRLVATLASGSIVTLSTGTVNCILPAAHEEVP
jgi:hypothetical protein